MNRDRDELELRRIAAHEAGHAVAAYLLPGARVSGPVSIEEGASYEGIAFVRGSPTRSRDLGIVSTVGLVGERASVRRQLETEAIITLAGVAGERLRFGVCPDAHSRELARLRAERGWGAKPKDRAASGDERALPRREARMLYAASVAERVDDDLVQAERALGLLVGHNSDRLEPYLALMLGEAHALLQGSRAKRMVHVLAEELLAAGTLSRRRVLEILAGNDPEQAVARRAL